MNMSPHSTSAILVLKAMKPVIVSYSLISRGRPNCFANSLKISISMPYHSCSTWKAMGAVEAQEATLRGVPEVSAGMCVYDSASAYLSVSQKSFRVCIEPSSSICRWTSEQASARSASSFRNINAVGKPCSPLKAILMPFSLRIWALKITSSSTTTSTMPLMSA